MLITYIVNAPGSKRMDARSRLGHGAQAAIPDELHQEVSKQMAVRLRLGSNQFSAHYRQVCHPKDTSEPNNPKVS
jgi:hypothetical protein